jgi:Phosphotransferase enzyme family
MMNLDWNHEARGDGDWRLPPNTFPQLDDALRPVRIIDRINESRVLPFAPRSCEILNVWWIPEKSFYVVYSLVAPSGPARILTLRFFGIGGSEDAFALARTSCADPRVVHHIPKWHAVGWEFPADPAGAGMAPMMDLGRVREMVFGGDVGARAGDIVAWRLLSYLPGERCVMGYADDSGAVRYVGKVQKGAFATHRRLKRLWSLRNRGFDMAEPVAADDAIGARWERFVPGQRIDRQMDPSLVKDCVARAMQGLSALHRTAIEGLPARGADIVLDRTVRKVGKRIAAAIPGLTAEAKAFAQVLTDQARDLPERPQATIHGDFHTANVLFDGARPTFIDLDELAQGDPAYDLALFATRLLLVGIQRPGELHLMAELCEALPRLYAETGGEPIPEATYAWYVAALLVGRQIKTCIRHLAPDLETTSRTLLMWALATLERRRFDASIAEIGPR